VNRKAIDELKQQIPLLDYLQAHGWQPARSTRGGGLALRRKAMASLSPDK